MRHVAPVVCVKWPLAGVENETVYVSATDVVVKLLMLLRAGGYQVSSTDVSLASRQTVLAVAAAADEAPYPVVAQTIVRENQSVASGFGI